MVIDGHRHVGFAGWRGPCPAEQVLQDMKTFGIDKTLILPIHLPAEQDSNEDVRQAAAEKANRDFIDKGTVNDYLKRVRSAREDHREVAEAVCKHPDKLIGVFEINPWLGQEMLAEARKAVREQGFGAIKLNPMRHGFPADDPVVDPVVTLAARLGVPVMFHSCYGSGTEPRRIGKVAGRFPDVQVVLYHAGVIGLDGKTQVEGAIKAVAENPNVWIDLADSQPPALQAIVDRAPPERIVFGSDAPFGNLPRQLARVRDATGPRAELASLILGENLARLLVLG